MESYIKMLTNYFNFKDRTTRKDFWMTVLIGIVISTVLSIVVGFIAKVTKLKIYDIIIGLYTLALFIPSLAQLVRRMHDVNKSGWYVLLDLIPIIGWILVLVAMCSPSVYENNNYGVQL